MKTQVELADEFIKTLKEKVYGPGGWRWFGKEGDYGTWADWKAALVEFNHISHDKLFPIHSIVKYYSIRGVGQTGIIIGYGYIFSSDEPDVYLIEIGQPNQSEILLPLHKVVGIEFERCELVDEERYDKI